MDQPTATIKINKDAECYNMNHAKRGKCVIFNQENFDTELTVREGSTIDAKRIEDTFSNLGFEVEIFDDLDYSQIMETVKKLSEEDHSDNDCLCIFVLTHGKADDVVFAKNVSYKTEEIWKPFTADKCTSLAGKPKLFFFQACRGTELDAGVQMKSYNINVIRTVTDSAETYKIPSHADFLFAHSTAQGYYSWRSTKTGTWFIQCLCNVIDEYHTTKHLQQMLTICLRKVATDHSSHDHLNPGMHDMKQMPTITSTLMREVYFLPK